MAGVLPPRRLSDGARFLWHERVTGKNVYHGRQSPVSGHCGFRDDRLARATARDIFAVAEPLSSAGGVWRGGAHMSRDVTPQQKGGTLS